MRYIFTVVLLAACATGSSQQSEPVAPAAPLATWPVREMPHVDLWLHGFAMVSNDTAAIPLYRRGYRDSMTVVKNRANVVTSLDANRDALSKGMTPAFLQAQFFAFEYDSWESMSNMIARFLDAGGNAAAVNDRVVAAHVAMFAAVFRTAAERDWLRQFQLALTDEASRFYSAQRAELRRERSAVITAIDSLWHNVYRPRFGRFLANTSQRDGELILSAPLGGEGRTTMRNNRTAVAVTFPARTEDAVESILVFAHEVTGGLVASVVNDHTSPVERRSGVADSLVAIGQVRAGAMLIQKSAPELLDAYVRYYMSQGGQTQFTLSALQQHFALPAALAADLESQIDVVLGGI